ncbi:hypothetical protein LEWO105114_11715 [Legionella worsleiensis]
MIAAGEPLKVTDPVPLLVMVTPAVATAVKLPCSTETVVVTTALSVSATLKALPLAELNTREASSLRICAPDTLLTGASFTAFTVIVTVAVSVVPPEVTVYVKSVVPLKLAAGLKLKVPSAFKRTVPFTTLTEPPTAMAVPLIAVMV